MVIRPVWRLDSMRISGKRSSLPSPSISKSETLRAFPRDRVIPSLFETLRDFPSHTRGTGHGARHGGQQHPSERIGNAIAGRYGLTLRQRKTREECADLHE